MTPTPIPEWFERWAIEQANKGGYPNNHPISTYIAAASAAYRLLSAQQVSWVDAEDDLPRDQSIEYFVRWRKDGEWAKLTAFYDNDAKEFYTVEQNCRMEYMSTKEFKGLQWLDESHAPIQ